MPYMAISCYDVLVMELQQNGHDMIIYESYGKHMKINLRLQPLLLRTVL